MKKQEKTFVNRGKNVKKTNHVAISDNKRT